MVVSHYAYLVLKIPGPNCVITVKGNFEVSDTCDKEFHQMAQTFSMTAEYARLKGDTDHNVLPDVGRSLPDQAFDTMWDSKKVWVIQPIQRRPHLSQSTWTPHRKPRSSSSSVSAGKFSPGVHQTCQAFLGISSSTH
jgi:hypothetical protein